MTFAQVALEDFPSRLWVLDDSAPFMDYSHENGSALTSVETNLVLNPHLVGDTGWDGGTGGPITRRTTGGPDDGAYHRVTASGSLTQLYHGNITNNTILTPGKTYTASMWIRSNDATYDLDLYVSVVTNAGGTTRQVRSSKVKTSAWTLFSVTFTAASNETGFRMGGALYIKNGQSTIPSGVTIDTSMAMMIEGTSTDYFDGTTGWWNGTANESTASRYAPVKYHASLIKGASRAAIVGNSNRITFDAPIMKRGREDQPFTIEVSVRLIRKEDSTAQIQVFGTSSAMDGLVISGTTVSFTTKYTNTGEARCEFDVQEYQTMRIHCLHTKARNALYINGDLVDEVAITGEQQADTYLSAGTSLSSGTTTSANMLALNGLAIYTRTLDEADIDQHIEEAADNMDEFTVGAAFGGMTFALNSSTSRPLLEYTYTDDAQWNEGRMSGTVINHGQIVPQTVGGVSMAGLWETIVPLPPDSTLSSVTMNWLGEGEKVYTSLDGINWNEERRSARISTVNDGFTTDGKALYLRVTFDGGKTNDVSYFDSLVISMYGPVTTVAPTLETRTITLNNASIEADFDITDYHENWGIEINNGTFSLSGASTTAIAPRTIQVWAKKLNDSTFTDNMYASATNWYTNDGSTKQTYQVDEWQLRTYTFTNGFSDAITFTGTGQVGCLLIYPRVLTATEIKDSYTSFVGTKTMTLASSGTIGFVDISNLVEIYEYDWSIESAG